MRLRQLLTIIGPGILVAATGVGAGDLAMASLTGNKLGLVGLWAGLLGAFLKDVLTEGLTRWQLATDTTLLEGAALNLGRVVQWGFLAYLVVWSYLVAAALMSACGAVMHAIVPVYRDDPAADKILHGVVHSAVAAVLVFAGGYRLFARVMSACIAVMVVVVIATALAVQPDWIGVATGLVVPQVPRADGQGLGWTIALMGGVGGTVTILCYGYWIREEGRSGADALAASRIDLGVGYAVTALFGVAMVIIASRMPPLEGGGATLVVALANTLQNSLGEFGLAARWAFLAGAWGAVFSSLLGVWQSVPYLFADLWNLMRLSQNGVHERTSTGEPSSPVPPSVVDTRSPIYLGCLVLLATVPISGLALVPFAMVQKTYAIVGAVFIPMLATALLLMNGQSRLIGRKHRNSPLTSAILAATLSFFLAVGVMDVWKRFAS